MTILVCFAYIVLIMVDIKINQSELVILSAKGVIGWFEVATKKWLLLRTTNFVLYFAKVGWNSHLVEV